MTSREAYIALNMVDGIGPIRLRALLERFREPAAILAATKSELMHVEGVGEEVARSITGWREKVDLDAELQRIEKSGVRVVTRDDAEYPRNLREVYDPPIILYVKGALSERDPLSIAIVGSRRTTLYGQDMARKLAYQLGRVGVTVVSGLARGIDSAAHQGTLQAKGRTVAVIGCGIDIVYPAENDKLAHEIVEKGGAVVTEFPFGVKPDKQNFPMRNRIISGWSLGVVVVEANLKSGALITAGQAAEQGRQVFAVPGRADSILSRGTNKLIKDGAKLTEDAEDILGEFEYLLPKTATETAETAPEGEGTKPALKLSEIEEKVMAHVGRDETAIDEIIRASGLTTACVSATLLSLEMKRLVRQLPGKLYVRNAMFGS
ncbi:MAG TPA: DNA-processing protein DprA [Verrucomicrobiae bacterium]|nr:DNA-processing protein DprA [Verrucomicrobiae bacterium]